MENVAGHGIIARSLSAIPGSGGMSAIARLCFPENAIVNTQKIGYKVTNVTMINTMCRGQCEGSSDPAFSLNMHHLTQFLPWLLQFDSGTFHISAGLRR